MSQNMVFLLPCIHTINGYMTYLSVVEIQEILIFSFVLSLLSFYCERVLL